MKKLIFFAFFIIALTAAFPQKTDEDNNLISDESKAIEFLKEYNEKLGKLSNAYSIASWNYNTNLTDANKQKEGEISKTYSNFDSESLQKSLKFDKTNFSYDTKRQLKKVGSKKLPDDEEEELTR